MAEENQLMIISRWLSPNHELPSEIIYSGSLLDENQIPKVVNIGPEDARKYWYTISKLKIKDKNGRNVLDIRNNHVTYEAILRGYNQIDMLKGVSTAQIPLNDSVKKGLVKLLEDCN